MIRFPGAVLIPLLTILSGCAHVRGAARSVADLPVRAGRAVRGSVQRSAEDIKPQSQFQKEVLESAAMFPGGGYLYMDNTIGPDHALSPSVFYMLSAATAAFFISKGISDHKGSEVAAAAGGLVVLRFSDIRWSMRSAKRRDPTMRTK